jgi:hypothetical protein
MLIRTVGFSGYGNRKKIQQYCKKGAFLIRGASREISKNEGQTT